MEMREYFKMFREEICSNCTNKDCENGKGAHICCYKDEICVRCTDYKKKKTNIKGYIEPEDRTENYKKMVIHL